MQLWAQLSISSAHSSISITVWIMQFHVIQPFMHSPASPPYLCSWSHSWKGHSQDCRSRRMNRTCWCTGAHNGCYYHCTHQYLHSRNVRSSRNTCRWLSFSKVHTITSSLISIQPESTVASTSIVTRSVSAELLARVRSIGSTFVNFCVIFAWTGNIVRKVTWLYVPSQVKPSLLRVYPVLQVHL